MRYIRINCREFDTAVNSLNRFIENCSAKMRNIDSEVSSLGNFYKGPDYQQFVKSWKTENSSSSVSGKMLTDLKNYRDFLTFSAKVYRDAQSRSINRARNLPR